MSPKIWLATILIGYAGVLAVIGYPARLPASAGSTTTARLQEDPTGEAVATDSVTARLHYYYPHSLELASTSEWAEQALGFVEVNFRVASGHPVVVYAESVLATELAPLGLIDLPFPDGDPPLAVVIVRGDFDFGNAVPRGGFIASTLNLRTGNVLSYSVSYDGSRFGHILNDPSIPVTPPTVRTPVPRQTMPPQPLMAVTPTPDEMDRLRNWPR